MPNPILDQSALENLLATIGSDKAFFAEMVNTFLADSPRQITAMRDAAANNHAEKLRRAAHSLKSNAANFGAVDLARLCKELEEQGKQGALVGAAERIAMIEAEYGRVKSALHTIVKS